MNCSFSKSRVQSLVCSFSKTQVQPVLSGSVFEQEDSDPSDQPGRRISAALNTVQRLHDETESKVLKKLLLLDEGYRNYFKTWNKEMELQRMAAEKLWRLTKAYTGFYSKVCKLPQNESDTTEDNILSSYQLHYQIIRNSNVALSAAIDVLRRQLLAFRRKCALLDLQAETPFVLGDSFHKPIKFFIELAEELFNYFYSGYLKLYCCARLMEPAELSTLERYQQLLERSEEFEEYLFHNLGYCRCLGPPLPCPKKPVVPQMQPSEVEEAMKRAKLSRCARRMAKMSATNNEPEPAHYDAIMSSLLDPDHERRMSQLNQRINELRRSTVGSMRTAAQDRALIEQIINTISPSSMYPTVINR
ncbi:CG31910 [Drosophila busckii]|uniref:CG31910 n=1 Tax=Drosophila busckii TaxID=30019 RepID=A0A0M5IXT4_DROBS|nr:uncharacterized protein LOC108596260 [Drosophila busckii]ALC42048.1 CG31910 [Drosophila busckii]